MSDENCCGACGYPSHTTKESACDWCRQAADRIEALTADLARSTRMIAKMVPLSADGNYVFWDGVGDIELDHNGELRETIEALTAKLAKAVEALEIIRDRQYYRMGPGITAQVIARATLATLKGDKP